MNKFLSMLLEELTPDQEKYFSHYKMTDKARADTDHYFGKDNDLKTGPIHMGGKSDLHKEVEAHIGHEMTRDQYYHGKIQDPKKPDRPDAQLKVGKLIKDKDLRDRFAVDPARDGKVKPGSFTYSVHRGTQVANQTNIASTKSNPGGHDWPESCKRINDKQMDYPMPRSHGGTGNNGINAHYIPHEIKHGSVLTHVHDHKGKEIYRALLHPHSDSGGNTVYAINGEYGNMRPEFKAHSRQLAKDLSVNAPHDGVFHMHHAVYTNNKPTRIAHPAVGGGVKADIDHMYHTAIDIGGKHAEAFLRHPDADDRRMSDVIDVHYHDLMHHHHDGDEDYMDYHNHPNAGEHTLRSMLDKSSYHTSDIVNHHAMTARILEHALDHHNGEEHSEIIHATIHHPNATPRAIKNIFDYHGEHVDEDHVKDAIDRHGHDSDVLHSIMKAPNADGNNMRAAMDHILKSPHVKDEHLAKYVEHHVDHYADEDDAEKIKNHPKAGPMTQAALFIHHPETFHDQKQIHDIVTGPHATASTHDTVVNYENNAAPHTEAFSKWKVGKDHEYGDHLRKTNPNEYTKQMSNVATNHKSLYQHGHLNDDIVKAVIDHSEKSHDEASSRWHGANRKPSATGVLSQLAMNPSAKNHPALIDHLTKKYPGHDIEAHIKHGESNMTPERAEMLRSGGHAKAVDTNAQPSLFGKDHTTAVNYSDGFDKSVKGDNEKALRDAYHSPEHDEHSIDHLVRNRAYQPTSTEAHSLIDRHGDKMGAGHFEDLYHNLRHDVDRASVIRHHGRQLPDSVFDHAVNHGSGLTRAAAMASQHRPPNLR